MIRKVYSVYPSIARMAINLSNIFGGNSVALTNKVCGGGALVRLKRTKLLDSGKGNRIVIGRNSSLTNCAFSFFGNQNMIVIGENCNLNNVTFWIEDHNNTITIQSNTSIYGQTELACMEGTRINIGEDCMFSSRITFRTGDSHSVTDSNGNRINPSKDISIGNHVWIGQDVFLGKGSKVPDCCIVGAHAVVTRKFQQPNVAIAGNPAKIVKNNINWKRERI